MNEATEAEFDTVAEWTANVAVELGEDYHIPAACRGSGSPVALDWLADRMGLTPGQSVIDSGAGGGGPAAYAAQSHSVRPVLVEPETGACRAARTLFDHPVVRAVGTALPVADASFDAAWCLGVLCTTPDQRQLLDELRRAVRPGGAIGLLVFVAHAELPPDELPDNHFPSPKHLTELIESASLDIEHRQGTADLPAIPQDWSCREEAVTEALADRYGHTRAWILAERQSGLIGRLLEHGALAGELVVLRRR